MKLLLIKLGHVGDVLLMTPTLRFLRATYPSAQIDVVVRKGAHGVLEGNPDLTNLFVVAPPEKERQTLHEGLAGFWPTFHGLFAQGYDYGFDLSHSDRSRLWLWLSAARHRGANNAYDVLGKKRWMYNRLSTFPWVNCHQVLKDFHTVTDILKRPGEPGPLFISTTGVDSLALAKRLPCTAHPGKYAVIHPTSRWAYKQWRPERWAAVADWLTDSRGLSVVFSCGPDVREQSHVENILSQCKHTHFSTRGATSLRELAWIISQARLFCGVDTAAMHIAAAVLAPTVALFGPSQEWSWQPWQCRSELVLGDCPCKKAAVFTCDKSRLYPCMERITVAAVVSAAAKLIPSL